MSAHRKAFLYTHIKTEILKYFPGMYTRIYKEIMNYNISVEVSNKGISHLKL
jgi:hypothetical protein